MALPGLLLTVLAGATVPTPLPEPVLSRLRSATVTETDSQRSAFTLTLDAGRSGPLAAFDNPLITDSPLQVGARVVLLVTLGSVPTVLFDGVVTETTLTPGDRPGSATFEATGEDVSFLMDLDEREAEYPALSDDMQVRTILAPYLAHGIVPVVITPPVVQPPSPVEQVPTQQTTDLRHVVALAERYGFVAYTQPQSVPGISEFYWGPPKRLGLPQPALSVGLGAQTTVTSGPTFTANALAPVQVSGTVQDPATGQSVPVQAAVALRPPLAAVPLSATAPVRTRRLRESGTDAATSASRAQAVVDAGADGVVGEGELDAARYGAVLRPRGLVGLRGAGWSYDGLWYVRRVEHTIVPGSYRQKFTIVREGFGSTVPVVRV